MGAIACSSAAPARADEVAKPAPPPREDHSADAPRFPTSVDELSAPRLPPPFVMPELSHPDWDLGLSWLLGFAVPEQAERPTSALGLARATAEGDVFFPRRLYVGGTLPFASALAPDGTSGSKTVLGNVELHARVVFPLPSWLAFGAVFGLVVPTASYGHDTAAHQAATAAAALEPTDLVHFRPDTVAFRPGMDVRVLRGPFVVQARQGIDVALDTSGRAVTVGRFLGHAGIRVQKDIELSLEATQLYQFDERVRDDKRTAMTIGPGARLLLGGVDIGAAVVTNLFAPLSPAVDHFVAARISLIAHLE
jgi:hypothetical protein